MLKSKAKTKPKTTKRATKSHLSAIGAYDRNQLTKSLKIDAKGLDIPPAAADLFIQKTLDAVESSLGPRRIITERDLKTAIAKELKK